MNTVGHLSGVPMKLCKCPFRVLIIVGTMVVTSIHNTVTAASFPLLRRQLPIADTLDVFLQNNPSGRLVGTLSALPNGFISTLNLAVEMAYQEGVQHIEMVERREYGSDGRLLSAYQRMESPAGKNAWELGRNTGGSWHITVTTAGVKNSREVSAVNENISSMCALYEGVLSGALTRGTSWTDTSVELTSGEAVVTVTRCTGTPAETEDSCWVFTCANTIVDRHEIWKINRQGKTVFRDVYPYTARLPVPGKILSVNKAADPDAMFELMKIGVSGPLKEGRQRVKVSFGNNQTVDSSVSRFYDVQPGASLLLPIPGKCGSGEGTLTQKEKERYCAATSTLQSENSAIRHLADSLGSGKNDPCSRVRVFNHYVYSRLEKRNVAAFSSALETLEAGYGDCGEHAVLLAALLRAAGIPARVVLGLLYVGSKKGYYYHAWVTAYTGTWIFADPSHDCFPANHDRVPLVIDDDGTRIMSMAKVIGRIRIEHVEVGKR
jgi:hypothetical protein